MMKKFGIFGFGALMLAVLLAAPASVMAIGFQVPGTNTTLDVGGYVKLDIIYNDVSAGDDSQANIEYSPSEVPLENTTTGEEDEIVFNGRESRMWLKSTTPTDMGPLKTHLEMDFDTTSGNQVVSNSRGMRLRHAYGTLNNWLFGQTWSLFMHLDSLPEINDFGGPTGSMFVRQAQLRYTMALNDTNSLAFSLENPETYFYDGGFNVADDDNMPDVIVRWSMNPTWGNLSAAVMVRNLVVDNGAVDDSATAVAGQVGGVLKIGAKDSLMGAVQYGQGIGRYSSLASHPDATVDASGNLDALDQVAGFIGYQHYWVGTWRSSFIVGYSKADDPAEINTTDATEKTLSFHANLMYSPVEHSRLGIEFIRGTRDTYDGQEGELNRVQFSAMFDF
jgi:hypothetical protein